MQIDSILTVHARQVLDSRGNPTVEADVSTASGHFGRGTVPSGASTGLHEAIELRDGDPTKYGGMGVMRAVRNVNDIIGPSVIGMNPQNIRKLDAMMLKLDGTPNKGRLGANAILAVSLAVARAGASSAGLPLYRFLADKQEYRLPIPMMNIINGGKHAGNGLAVQEFVIEPVGTDSFADAVRMGSEVYHSLKDVLRNSYGTNATNVGDEGGYAPPMDRTEQPLDSILTAVRKAGYDETTVRLGMDAASSGFYDSNSRRYRIDGREMDSGQLLDFYVSLVQKYHINTLEDPFDEESFDDFAKITDKLGRKTMIIGDDLYVTNPARIRRGIELRSTNAVLIKLNQIGSVTETLDAAKLCRDSGLATVVSHRSGETEDVFIPHLATAIESVYLKSGAPARGERTAKYNELIRIEEELGGAAKFPKL